MKSRRIHIFAATLSLLVALLAPAAPASATTKQVALTFDDAFNETRIRQIMAIAVSTNTPITFFPTGRSLNMFPNLWKAIGSAGIPIANHTVNHPNLTKRYAVNGAANVRAEFQGFINIARNKGIPIVPYWRPPGGAWNANVLKVAKGLGLTLSMWTNTFADTARMCKNRKPYSKVKSSFTNATRTYTAGTSWWSNTSGGTKVVVLGHAGPAVTVRTLAAVIANYTARGYQFVTIPEMASGTPSVINWSNAATAISAPAKSGGPLRPTSAPTPVDHTDATLTFAAVAGISCR
jgi:peptidoglycan/xylan/chitin deacetylase (PgdA/CDA1 family)